MNPSATDRQVFGLPENTPARTRQMLPHVAAELLQRLDSTSRDDYRKFFLGSEPNADPPQRSGYFVGYLIAERIGAGRPLHDLAKMPAGEVRRAVEEILVSFRAPYSASGSE
jgi:TorA maturation chaperone TorD